MIRAAELLRGLDKAATAAPWKALLYDGCGSTFIEPNINSGNGYEGEIKEHDARLIATTRNLLLLLADYIAAGDRVIALARPEFDTAEARHAFSEAVTSLERASAALNAAAAKEVK